MQKKGLQKLWKRVAREGKVPLLLPLILGIGLASVFVQKIELFLLPQITALAESKLHNELNILAAEVMDTLTAKGALSYSELVSLSSVQGSEVTTLSVDTGILNQLRTEMVASMTARMMSMDRQRLRIPVGLLTGIDALSGVGPKIPICVITVASVTGDYRNEFTEAGINQTHHRVMLDMTVRARLVFAGQVEENEFLIPVCMTEGIILGKVPQTYLNWNE